MRTLMAKSTGLVLISIVMLSGLTLPYDLSWGTDHTIPNMACMPVVLWTRGCSPTATSMVLGYYDNYVPYASPPCVTTGRGRLIDYWMDLSDHVDGRNGLGGIHNVPNLLDQLRVYMSTDGEGGTIRYNIGAAIKQLTFDKGYYFDSNDCIGDSGDNNDCWDDIVYEISQGRPFVWSIGYEGQIGHSLAAWGYVDGGYVITYNTWNSGRDDWFYTTYDNNGVYTDKQMVTSAVPGVPDDDNQVYLDYWLPRKMWGGEIVTVKWYQSGTFITNVDLQYSEDGGQNWNYYIAQGVASAPGWNSYDWTVPNISSDTVRVRVTGYEPSRNLPWYGWVASDGSRSDLQIVQDTTPPSGSILINGGETYATSPAVMLTLSATDYGSGIDKMCISGIISSGGCEPYTPAKSCTLDGGDGAKTVGVVFIDRAGNGSLLTQASIILDTTPPSGSITMNNGDAATASTSVKLGLSASDANGVPQMCISNATSCYSSQWEPFATSKSWTLPPGDATKTVYAMFKDGAGNLSALYSHSIVLDTTAPGGSVTINGGAAFANSASVNLTLSASGATEMCIRNDSKIFCNGLLASWEPYTTTKQWTLSGGGDGVKNVYVTFSDAAGNESPMYSDSIILDTSTPTGSVKIKGKVKYTNSPSVNLKLSASDPSGVTQMCIRNDSRNLCSGLLASWEPYTTTKAWTLSGGGDGVKNVYVTFSDAAGNESPMYSDSITLDTNAPTGSVKINGKAKYTNSPSVNLTLSASDPNGVTEMCITDYVGITGSFCIWQPYVRTTPWTLSSGDGTKTLYATFSDAAGNESPTYSGSITLDTTPPTDGRLSAVPGNGQVSLKWSGFSDTGSGVATYTLLLSTTDHPGFIKEATKIYSGTRTSYVHKGLTNGTMYFYRVCATDKAGNTSTGMTASAIPGSPLHETVHISVAPTAYDFGNVSLNDRKTASFKVTNGGTGILVISNPTITGTDASMFTIISGSGSKRIDPGKGVIIKVAFEPTSEGEKTANLEITSNDPVALTTNIALSGKGQ